MAFLMRKLRKKSSGSSASANWRKSASARLIHPVVDDPAKIIPSRADGEGPHIDLLSTQ
jgi:hypothetical protein